MSRDFHQSQCQQYPQAEIIATSSIKVVPIWGIPFCSFALKPNTTYGAFLINEL